MKKELVLLLLLIALIVSIFIIAIFFQKPEDNNGSGLNSLFKFNPFEYFSRLVTKQSTNTYTTTELNTAYYGYVNCPQCDVCQECEKGSSEFVKISPYNFELKAKKGTRFSGFIEMVNKYKDSTLSIKTTVPPEDESVVLFTDKLDIPPTKSDKFEFTVDVNKDVEVVFDQSGKYTSTTGEVSTYDVQLKIKLHVITDAELGTCVPDKTKNGIPPPQSTEKCPVCQDGVVQSKCEEPCKTLQSLPKSDACCRHCTCSKDGYTSDIKAVTVMIEVIDSTGISHGSGTLIGNGKLLTCGHIFRNFNPATDKIRLRFYDKNGKNIASVYGTLNKKDLDCDASTVNFNPPAGISLPSAQVADSNYEYGIGDTVISAGYDKGLTPITIKPTTISHLNKFLGPKNIETKDMPVEGRSGGGLFTPCGKVIGICNAADRIDNEGLYAGIECIHKVL